METAIWTDNQWIALSIIPRFTGFFSIVGSSAIIYMILSDREKKLVKSYHRIMLVMSFFDILQSVALAASTSAFPRETPIYGSIGNMSTCRVQFIFLTLGLAVPMCNASLSIYYLLTIKYRYPSRDFARKIEPFLHASSVLVPTSIVILSSVTKSGDVVIPADVPYCAISLYSWIGWIVVSIPIFSFSVCLYSMLSISCYASKLSTRVRRFSFSENQINRRESETKATIRQAMFYTLAFVITFIFPGLFIFVPYFTFAICYSIFYPLQGFWNFVLYVRPIVMKRRETTPEKFLFEIVWSVIFRRNEREEEVNQKQSNDRNTKVNQTMKRLANLDLDSIGSSVESDEEAKIDR